MKTFFLRGPWVAQSVKCLTLAQVMISLFMSSTPPIELSTVSIEPVLDLLSPALSAPPLLSLSLSLSKINIKNIFVQKQPMLITENLGQTDKHKEENKNPIS